MELELWSLKKGILSLSERLGEREIWERVYQRDTEKERLRETKRGRERHTYRLETVRHRETETEIDGFPK